jgi:predicted SAM-dependent methyltransferase
MPRLLNIGCGTVFDARWQNLDLVACAPEVRACDILKGLPAADGSLDGVYSSHVLEHLTPAQAKRLMRDVWRALRPGGIIRVVVPDLEGIARAYLSEVDQLQAGREDNKHRHRWMLVELLDQMTRSRSGWTYPELIRDFPEEDLPFAEGRLGRAILDAYRGESPPGSSRPLPLRRRVRLILKQWLNRRLGIDLDEARFRASGEVHQWMYDAYSLAELLQSCGFIECGRRSADQSDVPGWSGYALDLDPEGRVRKPDSLFMEARKPCA